MPLSIILHLIANFFAGAFFCNSIPHLSCGLRGEPFPSPFARPMGVGLSSPLVNFLWGFLNLVTALALLCISHIQISLNTGLILFLLAFFLLGIYLSWRFGKVRGN